jgi:hypothetical protein
VGLASFAGCGATNSNGFSAEDGGGSGGDDGGSGASCPVCVKSTDCSNNELCVQLGSDSYCAPTCGSGSSCASGLSCVSATTFDGKATNVCVPPGDCGGSSGGGKDGGAQGPGDASVPYDGGGAPVSGSIGPTGGSLSRLLFAVVGDTRPANYDDVSGYPTAIVTKIYQDIQAASPRPPFVLSTGDYQFSSSGSNSTASQQLDIYTQARKGYTGTLFPAMGNHECTGSTNSNCGPNGTNGITANYTAFMNQLLAPIQKTTPYYSIDVNATDNSWTAKFVFVAANAWDSTQQSWLQSTLAKKTTYTFVIRHEPESTTNGPPGLAGSQSIMAQYPYTLSIVGHSHTYGHYTTPDPREVLIGNGGAPLSNSSKNYGYGVFSQRSDGAIVGDMLDYQTGKADSYFHFVVKPDGTLTQ